MQNDEIIEIIELTAKLMDLHEGDAFKIKNLNAAAFSLDRNNDKHLASLSIEELVQLPSVGKSVGNKILEIVETGTLKELDDLRQKTPQGVIDMFRIKGIGVKKIGQIWRELGIDNLHELQIACENGTIAALKGFGESTQNKILESMAFLQSQVGKLRMDKAQQLAELITETTKNFYTETTIVGQVAQRDEVVSCIQILVSSNNIVADNERIDEVDWLLKNEEASSPTVWRGKPLDVQVDVEFVFVKPENFINQKFVLSSADAHLAKRNEDGFTLLQIAKKELVSSEEALYEIAKMPYIVPEMRTGQNEFEWAANHSIDELVTWNDLKGILHNHSKYSDGKNTLREMAEFCKELGFEYFGIADHSKAASYANGMDEDRVRQQHHEIDQLNAELAPFKILKGIEADILGDGSLDYPDHILDTFDYVVASVHSNLTMGYDKAMIRLLAAIENRHTTILGHPTGRLLLSREGYPIDHKIIIDACAEHKVVIELNASPWRLDLDWRWIDYCMQRGVMISINPDAHERDGFYDMHYGVAVGRKAGLTTQMTFNALTLNEMEIYLHNNKIS